MAASYTGGDLVVDLLAAKGVERIFSVSGGPINALYHGTVGRPVRIVHTRHEAAAAFMAEGTGRATRIPGVCAVTLGPAITNTVTAALVGTRAGVPFLIIGGQAPVAVLDKEAIMSFDHLPIMAPVTKYAARVLDTDRIEEYVETAWRIMLAGRPGPAFLEIPVDILGGPARSPSMADREDAGSGPGLNPDDNKELSRIIAASRRPFLIAGDDVHWSDAGAELAETIDHFNAPFFTARLSRGAIDEKDPRWAGVGYLGGNPALREAMASADLVVLVGHDMEAGLGYGDLISKSATIVHCHPDAAIVGRYLRPNLGIVARSDIVLRAITAGPSPKRDRDWCDRIVTMWNDEWSRIDALGNEANNGIHPARLTTLLEAAVPANTTFVTSHGNIDFWADAALRISPPGRYMRAGQSGALGAEIPFGIAAKMEDPNQTVIVIVGDGGFGFHGLELETAIRYGVPLVIVIYDDAKWGAIALPQGRSYGNEVEMDLPHRSWTEVAEALGGYGEYVSSEDQVAPALERALSSGLPAVLQVQVRSVESPYVRFHS